MEPRAEGGGPAGLDAGAAAFVPRGRGRGGARGGRARGGGRGGGRGRGRGRGGGRGGRGPAGDAEPGGGDPGGGGDLDGRSLLSGLFRLPERAAPAGARPPPSRRPAARRRGGAGSVLASRKLFLQASSRFFLSDAADLLSLTAEPDRPPDWDDVVLVEGHPGRAPGADVSAPLECPVCLEEGAGLLCPQITPCGHVFCFPCLMRLQASVGAAAAKCPLCFSPFTVSELRHYRARAHAPVRVGQPVQLTALRRKRTSSVPKLSRGSAAGLFAKFSLLNSSQGTEAHRQAVREIERAAAGLAGGEEAPELVPVLYAALDAIQDRCKVWCERRCSALGVECEPRMYDLGLQDQGHQERTEAAISWPLLGDESEPAGRGIFAGNSIDAATEGVARVDLDGPPPPAPPEAGSNRGPPDEYLFYQVSDGQLLFLHPLNGRCLQNHFGGALELPESIEAPVLEIEAMEQTEESRRRYKFLAHVPLTSSFSLVEVDLSGVVPPEALEPFAAEARKRKARRERAVRQAASERRQEERAERAARDARAGQAAPSASELLAMPTLPTEAGEESMPHQVDLASSPEQGVSFSRVAEWGLASGLNAPALNVSDGGMPGPGSWGGRAGTSGPPEERDSPLPGASPPPSSPAPAWGPRGHPAAEVDLKWTRKKKGKGKSVMVLDLSQPRARS